MSNSEWSSFIHMSDIHFRLYSGDPYDLDNPLRKVMINDLKNCALKHLKKSGDGDLDRVVFDQINEKLESSTIDFYDWKNISRVLPEVSLEQSWDKCLRLRLAFQDILGLKVY